MTAIVFDAALFRKQIPKYADTVKYPDDFILIYWEQATYLVSSEDYGCMAGFSRAYALNLLTAHLMDLSAMAVRGKVGGFISSSTIDKVIVQRLAPPVSSGFDWWLNQTMYGQALLALLEVSSVGGFNVGGLPEGSAFRKVGGIF